MGEASVSKYLFPIPTGAGKVKDGPLDFKELAERMGKLAGTTAIATEQATSSTSYVTLATPDEVELVMPTEGLIAVAYQAVWKENNNKSARAAIFLGATQLKVAVMGESIEASQVTAAIIEGSTVKTFKPLTSYGGGLVSIGLDAAGTYGGDVTTGQVVGIQSAGEAQLSREINAYSEVFLPKGAEAFGPCFIFAAAGTYKVSIKFKNTEAEATTVKNRKLWAWVVI